MDNDDIFTFTKKYSVTGWKVEEDIRWVETWVSRHAYVGGPSMLNMRMPLDKITELVNLDKKAAEEYNIRMNNPTVAKAYEQYRTLLNLVK
jgi:hypothetical protein